MQHLPITGYANLLSVSGGEEITFHVSTIADRFEARLIRLARRPELFKALDADFAGEYEGRVQEIRMGSYGYLPGGMELPDDAEISLDLMLTGAPGGRAAGILTWGERLGLFLDDAGRLLFRSGAAETTLPGVLERNRWYHIRVEITDGSVALSLRPVQGVAAGQLARVELGRKPEVDPASFRLSGWWDGEGTTGCIDAKISTPEIRSARRGVIARWDCAVGFDTNRLTDRGPYGRHIRLVNHPRRAVTGPRWTGRVLDYRLSPLEYDAIAFHQDDMTDAQWSPVFSWQVPKDLPSDIYAVELTCSAGRDHIPFIVRPGAETANKIAFLAPTFSYLAYANEQHWWSAPDIKEVTGGTLDEILSPGEKWVHRLGMLSCYDRHKDGTGCAHSSWLRPVVNFRADYVHPYIRGPHQLSGDMYILDWLRASGKAFDVITDHDLHQRGSDLLKPYNLVISGSHPEYVSGEILDGIDQFVSRGGNFMYVGGNGFHSVGTIYPDAPHVFELRRGHAGGLHWKSPAGEDYHAATGEPGGLWVLRNRAPQRIFGVGTASVTFGQGKDYKRTEESFDPKYAWIFEGVEGDSISAKSVLLGGPAGFEYDRMDFALGSPPETVLLATAYFDEVATEYTINDSRWTGAPAENRSDIILIEAPMKGSVFAAGSVSWTTALFDNDGDNAVAKVMGNVVTRFSSPQPDRQPRQNREVPDEGRQIPAI